MTHIFAAPEFRHATPRASAFGCCRDRALATPSLSWRRLAERVGDGGLRARTSDVACARRDGPVLRLPRPGHQARRREARARHRQDQQDGAAPRGEPEPVICIKPSAHQFSYARPNSYLVLLYGNSVLALSVFSRDDVKVASAAAVRRAQLKEKGAIPTKTRREPVKMGRLT